MSHGGIFRSLIRLLGKILLGAGGLSVFVGGGLLHAMFGVNRFVAESEGIVAGLALVLAGVVLKGFGEEFD